MHWAEAGKKCTPKKELYTHKMYAAARAYGHMIKLPVLGEVYEIVRVDVHPKCGCGNCIGVQLKELDQDIMWLASMFEPLNDTDVKLFESWLAPTKVEEDA